MRNRFWNSTGFFFVAWAFHYFPFYLMNRQLFLHHYLPAHLCSALVAGSVFNFIAGESINYPVSNPGPGMRRMPSARSDVGTRALIAFGLYMIPLFAMFVFLAPLTYGTPGYVLLHFVQVALLNLSLSLDGNQVNRRRILSTWSLHFAGKATVS